MSNFKKFLALVLATLMVAGMMVFTAPATSAYAPTGDYADDIALLNAFNVMKGDGVSFGEKDNVTRWHMALFVAQIVTGETDAAVWAGDKSDFFTDVTADHWPGAIDFCAEMGFIKGIGDNKFDPEGNITYQDGLTLLVRLLGYETENMTYPWGYILAARKIKNNNGEMLTDEIDAANKDNLLREEVANLLAKAIYVDIKDADGKSTGTTYVESGLNAKDLGAVKLISAQTASIGGVAVTGDVRYAKFEISAEAATAIGTNDLLDGTTLTVKVANITKNADFHINDYLGFTGSLVWVNGAPFVKMDNVKVVDSYGDVFDVNGDDIRYNKVTYTNTLTYGTVETNVFVDAAAANLTAYGRIYICDVGNDGYTTKSSAYTESNEIVRFVPFDRVSALYAFEMKNTASNNAILTGINKNDYLTMYYEPFYADEYVCAVPSASLTLKADIPNWAKLNQFSTHADKLNGIYLGNGVTNGITDGTAASRAALTSFSTVKYAQGSNLYIAVNGDFVSGQVHVGNSTKVGKAGFITVGKAVEETWAEATLTSTGNGTVVLGDTTLTVGFDKIGAKANWWYFEMSDATAAITANIGDKVSYMTVDGVVTYIKAIDEEAATKADTKTKAPIVLVVDTDEDKVVLNDNGTITVPAFDLNTLEMTTVTIDQFDGKNVGTLINSFGVSVAASILGSTATELDELVADLIKSNANPYAADLGTVTYGVVAQLNKADDVYSVGTKDLTAKLKTVVLGAAAANNAADSDGSVTLTFKKYSNNALSTNKYVIGTYDATASAAAGAARYDFAGKYLTLNKDSKITVIGNDGIKTYTGSVPSDGDTVVLAEAANAAVLALSTEQIILVNLGAKCDDLVKITGTTSSSSTSAKGGWYTLSWKTAYVGMTATTVGETTYYNYKFDKMFNLDTMAAETVVISTNAYYADPAISIFGDEWLSGNGASTAVDSTLLKDGKFKSGDTRNQKMYKVYYIGENLGDGIKASSIYSWAAENEWNVGVVKTIVQPATSTYVAPDANTLVIENATLTPVAGTGYSVNLAGDDTKDVNIVVSYSIALMNQSKDSKADEVKTVSYTDTTGYQSKMTPAKSNELVLYKVDDNGVCTIIVNFADQYNAASSVIMDNMAK